MDNDVYGHVNNVVYYSYFDAVVNEYFICPPATISTACGVLGSSHRTLVGGIILTVKRVSAR